MTPEKKRVILLLFKDRPKGVPKKVVKLPRETTINGFQKSVFSDIKALRRDGIPKKLEIRKLQREGNPQCPPSNLCIPFDAQQSLK